MSYNLPNPSLEGILLAVSTHNGPQIAFSYPEHLCIRKSSRTDERPEEASDDEDYEIENDSEISGATKDPGEMDVNSPDYYLGTKYDLMTFLDMRESHQKAHSGVDSARKGDKVARNGHGSKEIPKNHPKESSSPHTGSISTESSESTPRNSPITPQILGFEPDQLSEMLCPPRAMCNRRFDVMLENVVFLGLPIHVDSHGSWRKKQHGRTKSMRSETGETATQSPPGDASSAGTAMSMFHLVFIMRPPDIERNFRVDEMFYNVTSKLSLVLRYEQQKHDYVWNEVRQISRLKEEFRSDAQIAGSMTQHLTQKSAFCKLVMDCFHAITASKIANLNVNGKLRSFQIPLKMEFHSLPDQTVPYIPGSCLSSTINCLGSAGLVNTGETARYSNNNLMELLLGMAAPAENAEPDADDDDANTDDIVYLALLLWDDPDAIIRDIKAEPTSAIARFVRMLTPTESLLKIAQKLQLQDKNALSMAEIKSFALHLVYWRRARVIPPLSTRAIYIVSPMAPIATKFHGDIVEFNHTFPTVPSLPSFLRLLSARSRKPRQFAAIIPSRDHKDMYLTALAWLVRYGYVTQLHTYIWLKVPKKVKMKVEEELEEELGKAPKRAANSSARSATNSHLAVDNSSKQIDTGVHTGLQDDMGHFSKETKEARGEDIERLQKRFEASSLVPDLVLEDDADTILVDPGRASSLERRWINKIIHDECGLSPELTAVFYKLLKYMNGKNSLELLLLRENVSRTELRKLLSEIDEYIISVRHW
ncbi:hypothetical protein OXX69_000438 [Metschnikowia pulcherrima]